MEAAEIKEREKKKENLRVAERKVERKII